MITLCKVIRFSVQLCCK